MNYRTLREDYFKGRRVLLRTDFNVPLDDSGNVMDDKRIIGTLPTLNHLISEGAKVIIITHAGRPNGKVVEKLRLDGVSARLSELIGRGVTKLDDYKGEEVEKAVGKMKDGDVVMLENLRFYPGEKSKDESERLEFAKELARLADFYVNDAFANCHRDHASMTGIPKYLPSFAGFLVEKEITTIQSALEHPKSPFISIIGGAKADKLNAVKNLAEKSDFILLGGSIGFLFLREKGVEVGATKVDIEGLDKAALKALADSEKIILPVDAVLADEFSNSENTRLADVDSIPSGWMALDLGPKTVELYKNHLKYAKTIIWNGPLGVFEMEKFAKATKGIAEFISNLKATTIIGGGDSAAAVEAFGLSDKMTHVSTGGGASLKLFEGKHLVAIDALEENAKKFLL